MDEHEPKATVTLTQPQPTFCRYVSLGDLDAPCVALRAATVRGLPADGLAEQFESLVAEAARALRRALKPFGALIVPEAQQQRIKLRVERPAEDGSKLRYRFEILLLGREDTSDGPEGATIAVVPRIFGDVVRSVAGGVLETADADDTLHTVCERILGALAGLSSKDRSAASGDPGDMDAMGGAGAESLYSARLYELGGYDDEPSLKRRLARLTQQVEEALSVAFKSRGAAVVPSPQAGSVSLRYKIPHFQGGARLFDFTIELQVTPPSSPTERAAVIPRVFGEVMRQSAENVLMAEERDGDFERISDEIEELLRDLAR